MEIANNSIELTYSYGRYCKDLFPQYVRKIVFRWQTKQGDRDLQCSIIKISI